MPSDDDRPPRLARRADRGDDDYDDRPRREKAPGQGRATNVLLILIMAGAAALGFLLAALRAVFI